MARYKLSPEAKQNLSDIWREIAPENEAAADKLLLKMFELFELASTQPMMGVQRAELSPTARILIEGSYVVIYEPAAYGILVVAVVYGGRHPANWLPQP